MIYFQAPRYDSAKWIIQALKLKKIMTETVFELFRGEKALLIISGTGPVPAASAASYLLGKYPPDENGLFIILEAVPQNESPTHMALIHKITDALLPPYREYFPDLLYRHPFKESALVCQNAPPEENTDTESAYAFAVASRFMYRHQIIAAKFRYHPADTEDKQKQVLDAFLSWVYELCQPEATQLAPEQYYLSMIKENLHLTAAMVQIISSLAADKKRKHLDATPILAHYATIKTANPKEAKKQYEALKSQLE